MKSLSVMFVAAGITLGVAGSAQATDVGSGRNFGLGFQVGSPTAIVGKYFLGGGNALDFGLGFGGIGRGRCRDREGRYYGCRDYRHLSIHADYLWQENLARGTAKLDWHIGVGGRVIAWNDDDYAGDDELALIARMPLGLDLTFNRPDFLEVFFEIAPGLEIVPELWFNIDVGIGVRFYF